jgi:hypothetical protein
MALLAAELHAGRIRGARFLFDQSFINRDPGTVLAARAHFGPDCIRVALTHAKFAIITADDWKIVLRTSANLNLNKRFEDFTIGHNPNLHAFLLNLYDDFFDRQERTLADQKPGQIARYWADHM